MRRALRPEHSEFSRFFPRIRGTPVKRVPFKGRRFRIAHDWSKTGCHAEVMNFFEWADKIIQATAKQDETFQLTGLSLRPLMSILFTRYCDGKRIMGTQRATMKRFMVTELTDIRKEIEATSAKVVTKPTEQWKATPGFERNQRCWCGSGKKYKRCHNGEIPS